ncbi:MAG: hypothetical protein V3V67_00675 [Myxococcota bacterium]
MKPADEPYGASFSREGTESGFSLLSRGDRVRGRLARPESPGTHPLILIAGPDGCARSDSVDGAMAAWTDWAVVAAIDLPLCGSRRSDKVSLSSLETGDSLVARLRGDLEIQVEADLERSFAFLRGALGDSPAAFFGSGLGAELALPFCRNASGLDAVALAPLSPVEASLGDHVRIFAPRPTREEVAEFLRSRLL